MVNAKSKGKKNVLALTTLRPLLGVTKDDGKVKPIPLKLYDFTKGGQTKRIKELDPTQ